jgi:hypothetical protein
MEKEPITYIILALLVWAVLGTVSTGYYFTQYEIYRGEFKTFTDEFAKLSDTIENLSTVMKSTSLRAQIFINYGNGTKNWYNRTILPIAATAFTGILAITDLKYVDYGGELGILITSINGITGNSTHGWLYWHWDSEKTEWILPEYSCTRYILHREDIIAFTYQSYRIWPPPPPT